MCIGLSRHEYFETIKHNLCNYPVGCICAKDYAFGHTCSYVFMFVQPKNVSLHTYTSQYLHEKDAYSLLIHFTCHQRCLPDLLNCTKSAIISHVSILMIISLGFLEAVSKHYGKETEIKGDVRVLLLQKMLSKMQESQLHCNSSTDTEHSPLIVLGAHRVDLCFVEL